jgi:hypothetical protein
MASLDLSKRTGVERSCWRIRAVGHLYAGTVHWKADWLGTSRGDIEKPPARVGRDWALLGGTFEASRLPERGWTAEVVMPRTGRTA